MAVGRFVFPTVFQTKSVCLGPTITEVHITVLFTGSIRHFLTANGGTNWEEITLTTGTRKKHSFSNTGTDLRYMAVGIDGARITTSKKTSLAFDNPGIKIEITGHT